MPRVDPMPWPFDPVVDSRGRRVGWVVLHSHVQSPDRIDLLAGLLKSGARFVGMTSDGTFPAPTDPARLEPLEYAAICEAWAHCFRDPSRQLPDVPRVLLCDSDFTDPVLLGDVAQGKAPADAIFDFVYVGAPGGWKAVAKGWDLAKRCLPVLTEELGLRGLLVDVDPGFVLTSPRLAVVRAHPWPELMAIVRKARFLFAPNGPDASPRVLAEALSLDVPVVVNREILGGWHYVNPRTGAFFDDEYDVGLAVARLLEEPVSPRNWFRTHHGPYLAGRRLLRLLSSIDPGISEGSHVLLERRAGATGPGRSR